MRAPFVYEACSVMGEQGDLSVYEGDVVSSSADHSWGIHG